MQSVASLNLHLIVQTPDTIVIQSEWNRDARIIRMNATHAPAAIVSWVPAVGTRVGGITGGSRGAGGKGVGVGGGAGNASRSAGAAGGASCA